MEEKKNPGWGVIKRVKDRDKQRQAGYTTTYGVTYPLHSGGWRSSSFSGDALKSLKDAISAMVPGELEDGKGNRYAIEDYDTFLSHSAAAIHNFQNWEAGLRGEIIFAFTLFSEFHYSPEVFLKLEANESSEKKPASILERILNHIEADDYEDESSASENLQLRNYLLISREANKVQLEFIIDHLTKREKNTLRSCLKNLDSLRHACLTRILRMRRLDLADQFTFLMRRHVPENTPKSTIAATVSRLLASYGIDIKPISIYQRERRKKQ